MLMDVNEIQRIIPHRYPFLLVDAIMELEPAKRIVGLKNVSANEPFFAGHFPGSPVTGDPDPDHLTVTIADPLPLSFRFDSAGLSFSSPPASPSSSPPDLTRRCACGSSKVRRPSGSCQRS